MKYAFTVLMLHIVIGLASCNSTGVNVWQEELLQVDELRQKQITLEKDMIALKTQLAEAEKPEAVPKPAEKKIVKWLLIHLLF